MKNILLIIALTIGLVSGSFQSKNGNEKEPIIASKTITQVAVVVKDIDKASNAWAQVLGVKAPEVSIAEHAYSSAWWVGRRCL